MEEQSWGNLGYYDYNARFYNPAIGRWSTLDPKAEKYHPVSPYNYCVNNPVNAFDPNGEEVYFIFYNASDDRFKSAAQTREREIKGSKSFNPSTDYVYLLPLADLGKLSNMVSSSLVDAAEKGYGLTVEASFYTHGAADGPVGDSETSGKYNLFKTTGNPYDKKQMSSEGWSKINWNFDPEKSIAAFYGCKTDVFAEKFFNYSNVAFTAGQVASSGPTYNPTEWNKVWFPGKTQNVYYSTMLGGEMPGIATYQRGVYTSNEYDTWLKSTYIQGNVTVQNGYPQSASTINNLSSSQYVPHY